MIIDSNIRAYHFGEYFPEHVHIEDSVEPCLVKPP